MGELRRTVKQLLKRHKKHGSPRHGHAVAGLWDGDSRHPKGTVCEECATWEKLRRLVAK